MSLRQREKIQEMLRVDLAWAFPSEKGQTLKRWGRYCAIAGKAKILGDLVEPTVSDEEWEASFEKTARQLAGDPDAFK